MHIQKAAALVGLCGLAAAAAGNVTLWDQQPNSTQSTIANQEFADFPTFSTYNASDVSFTSDVTITGITTYYNNFNNTWQGLSGSARLAIFAKNGSSPDAGDDPTGGSLVAIDVIGNGSRLDIVSDGLSINLAAGDYWVVFTPLFDAGSPGQEQPLSTDNVIGDTTAYINPGRAFGFGGGWNGLDNVGAGNVVDTAITIRGVVVPAPGAMAMLGVAGLCATRRRR